MSAGTIDGVGLYGVGEAYASDQADRAHAYGRSEWHAERVARMQAAHLGVTPVAQEQAYALPPLNQKPISSIAVRPDNDVTWLQDQYANDRQANAILAFIKEQATLQARGDAANDLGTIQGMLLLQPYRFAAGVPLIQPFQWVAAASAVPNNVSPVFNVAAPRGATEDPLDATLDKRALIRRTKDGDT